MARNGSEARITALVTPFKDGAVDEEAFRAHVDWQIENGTHGLVPVGTTGESPTLSHDEHERVVEICVDEAQGPRAGDRRRRLEQHRRGDRVLASHAEKVGADAVLVVTPYYNKPTQEGLYQHFKAINDAVGIPIIIYNIPAALGDRHVGRRPWRGSTSSRTSSASRTRPPTSAACSASSATPWGRISSSSRART